MQHYNQRYFFGRLSAVEVKWSKRMTRCAGLCVYEGRGGLCSVRLSEPLLKFRPRKDLIDTLLVRLHGRCSCGHKHGRAALYTSPAGVITRYCPCSTS